VKAPDENDLLIAGRLPYDATEGCAPPIPVPPYEDQGEAARLAGVPLPMAPPRTRALRAGDAAEDAPAVSRAVSRPRTRATWDGTGRDPADDPPPDVAAQLEGDTGDGVPLDPDAGERAALADQGQGPTVEDPLRGLAKLGRVALVGRASILRKAQEPVLYTWQDIAVHGTIVMLAGGPSGGKTTLLFLLLAARMNLGPPVAALRRMVTPAPRGQWIVLIEAEHGEASTCRKLARSCARLGVDDGALDRAIIVARKAVKIGSPEWADVARLVAAGLVSDIACDTLARVAPADANDEQEQAAIFDRVAQVIEAAPPALAPMVWVNAHTRKGEGNSGEDVAGSAQRVGQVDTLLLVRGEKVGGQTVASLVTFWKLREEPDVYPAPVTFAIVKAPDGAESIRLDGAAPAVDDGQPLEAKIEGLLVTGPKTKTAIAGALKRSDMDVDAAIGNLFTTKRIASTTIKVRGVDRKAFALRDGFGVQIPRAAPATAAAPDPVPDRCSRCGQFYRATAADPFQCGC
jgi:hypothetical protein